MTSDVKPPFGNCIYTSILKENEKFIKQYIALATIGFILVSVLIYFLFGKSSLYPIIIFFTTITGVVLRVRYLIKNIYKIK